MEKVKYSDLGINLDDYIEEEIILFNGHQINVKTYLPSSDKFNLFENVLSGISDNKFINLPKLEILLALNIVRYYTNLDIDSLNNKDATQLYDELIKSNLLKQIYDILNKYGEFEELHRNLLHLAKSLIEYSNSAIGIIDGIASRYDDKTDAFAELKEQLKDKEALELVRDLLEKL